MPSPIAEALSMTQIHLNRAIAAEKNHDYAAVRGHVQEMKLTIMRADEEAERILDSVE